MAEKKRGPGRPPGSKNKTSKTTKSTKSSASRRTKTESEPKTKQEQILDMQKQRHADYKVIDEIWAITIIALGIFFIFTIMLDTTGAFGAKIHDICMGLFGHIAYLLPFYFIIFGALLLFQKMQHINGRTACFTALIFINICILNSYRFIDDKSLRFGFGDILLYYRDGVSGKKGGAIGMEIGSLLVKGFGKPGLIIIALAIIIISILLVVNTPLSKWYNDFVNKREARRLLREMEEAEARKQRYIEEGKNNTLPEIDFGRGSVKSEPLVTSVSRSVEPERYVAPRVEPLEPVTHDITETSVATPHRSKPSFFSAFTNRDSGREDKAKIERDKKNLIELSRDEGLIGKDAADITYPDYGKGLDDEAGGIANNEKQVSYGLAGDTGSHEGYGLAGYGYDTYSTGSGSFGLDGRDGRTEDTASRSEYREPRAVEQVSEAAEVVSTTAMNTTSYGMSEPEAKPKPAKKRTPSVTPVPTPVVGAVTTPVEPEPAIATPAKPNKAEELEDVNTDDVANDLNSGFNGSGEDSGYVLPDTGILKKGRGSKPMMSEYQLQQRAELLETTLNTFGVKASVVNVTQGASVTRYEVQPEMGVKVSKITSLENDIALNMRAKNLRIEAPIPGKAAVGIEVENDRPSPVLIRDLLESEEFENAQSKISFVVGKDITGNNIVANLKDMPHLLIAGATGSGKSVCINSIIASILYKAKPNEVKLILIDPKVVELGNYNGIPHLLTSVVTDPRKAARALGEAVVEMDKRYQIFSENGVRDLESYNDLMIANHEPQNCKPQVVIIVDELADLMMTAKQPVEDAIVRLAQKARAAGMHLILATQRPSVDVVTGLIKANVPSRIAFSVASAIDSRTILDMGGAEKLLGKGDCLFSPVGSSKPLRVQGPFISDAEIAKLISFVKTQCTAEYDKELSNAIEGATEEKQKAMEDELTEDAIAYLFEANQASVSMLQRRFRIGYNRAARIIDEIEAMGIIGPSDGSRPRQLLMTADEYYGVPEEQVTVDEVMDTEDDGVPEEISKYNEIIG